MPHLRNGHEHHDDQRYAAIFIDFENIFYYFQREFTALPDLTEYALELLRNLREFLENELGLLPLVRYAYADFERLSSAPMGSLYLMGIEIRNVLGAAHKNAADMRLCIDAMQTLYTRPDITTFVFVAGDRDYIPVIQHIQTQARTVKAVAFRGNLSGDLLQNIGDEHFIDARTLLADDSWKRLERDAAYAQQAAKLREEARLREQEELRKKLEAEAARTAEPPAGEPSAGETPAADPAANAAQGNGSSSAHQAAHHQAQQEHARRNARRDENRPFNRQIPIDNEDQLACLSLMLNEYQNHPEIWLSPFLRRLTDVLPRLADYERKNILFALEQAGAIKVELRQGEPYDYRVILLNYNHSAVRDLIPER